MLQWLIAAIAAALAVCVPVGMLMERGVGSRDVDRDEDPMEAEDRISTIKAALQEESTAHPHVPARNYWSAP